MKAFLFAHSSAKAPEAVYEVLNGTRAVSTWVSPFPYAAILLSNLSVFELSAVLQIHFLNTWFVVIEATPENCNGWLPPQFWAYINNPTKAFSDKIFEDLVKAYLKKPPAPRRELNSWQDFIGKGKADSEKNQK